MDKQKERHFWSQSPWGILILIIIGGLIVGFLLLLISDYNKVEPFLTNVNTALQSLWQYILNLFNFNIPLIWVLVTIIIARLMWVVFKRTKAYSKFFDKKYTLLQNEYTSLKKEHDQLTKEHEVVSGEGGFFLKEFAAANGRVKMLEEEFLSVNKESEQTKKKYANTFAALQETTKLLEEANQKIKELSPDETPTYLKYRRDKFKILIWAWEWSCDTLAKDWYITNLHPLCPNCGGKLIDKSLGIGKAYNKCNCIPCKLTFGYAVDDYSKWEESEDIEAIRKRIKSKVQKGNYKVRSRS
jgi:hypothetical protein